MIAVLDLYLERAPMRAKQPSAGGHRKGPRPLSEVDRAVRDIFGPGSRVTCRHVCDYDDLRRRVEHIRGLGFTIVLTSGAFDVMHVGHNRYLEIAKAQADVLIVGVDSDARIRKKKGGDPHRPVVPEDERIEQLCHSRHVDLVVLKGADDPPLALIECVRPDVLIVSDRNKFDREELAARQRLCGRIFTLETQADTSTTAKIRKLMLSVQVDIRQKLQELVAYIDRMGPQDDARLTARAKKPPHAHTVHAKPPARRAAAAKAQVKARRK